MLVTALENYLSSFRQPADSEAKALWIGRTGLPLSYSGVERLISSTTLRTLGVAISPHLIRSCASSFVYRYASGRPALASALLQHSDLRSTERHYNRARSVSFGAEFLKIVERRET